MKKLDLIIPTHNRTNLLKRILDYYKEAGQDFNFIIADSSNSYNKKINKTLVNQYQDLKILYLDKFEEKLPQHVKFAKMVRYAESKYVCFCADDDFITPTGIKQSINFLESNPTYSAAHGTYIGFYTHKNFLGQNQFSWTSRYSSPSISSESPLNRVTSHLKDFTLVLWAVRRTDITKKCYAEFLRAKIDPYLQIILGELLPDALTAVYGKIKRLETFYGARQYFGSIASNFATLIDAQKTGKYNTEYGKFKNSIINNLPLTNLQSRSKANILIDSAMETYNHYSYQEHLTSKLYSALNHYPKFISEGLRFLHATYLFSKRKEGAMEPIDNPDSKYYKDFNFIRKLVLSE